MSGHHDGVVIRVANARGDPIAAIGALIILCLSTGRSWGYPLSVGPVLLVVVAIALRNLRADSRRGG